MINLIRIGIACTGLCFATVGVAQNDASRSAAVDNDRLFSGVAFGITGGTLGAGGQITFGLNQSLSLRALIAGINLDEDFDPDDNDGNPNNDLDYSGDAKLFNVGALADWHLFGGGFRLSGGVIYTENRFEGSAICRQSPGCEVGGVPLAVANGERVDADVDFDGFAPYVGVGWGHAARADQGFSLSLDLGVMYTGDPDASVECERTNNDPLAIGLADCSGAAAQEERELEEDLDDLKFWPVVMLGAAYRF